jgi:hypothetical protein
MCPYSGSRNPFTDGVEAATLEFTVTGMSLGDASLLVM